MKMAIKLQINDEVRAERDRLRELLKELIDALPTNRDWLDPVLERRIRAELGTQKGTR